MARKDRTEFEHAFEGKEVLDGLLEIAGAPVDTEGVLVRMREALRQKERREAVIPSLFKGEPRFADPSMAKQLFQNLLGLWDLLEKGLPVVLETTPEGPKRPRIKKPIPERPPPFTSDGPDLDWVDGAWKYLDEAPEREVDRLEHSFENRQDALVGHLDEQGLSDELFGVARQLLFELHAMIELGWPAGVRSIARQDLIQPKVGLLPPESLQAYADEALFEAEQDEQAPLSPADSARVRALIKGGLAAMWNARQPRKESSTDA